MTTDLNEFIWSSLCLTTKLCHDVIGVSEVDFNTKKGHGLKMLNESLRTLQETLRVHVGFQFLNCKVIVVVLKPSIVFLFVSLSEQIRTVHYTEYVRLRRVHFCCLQS